MAWLLRLFLLNAQGGAPTTQRLRLWEGGEVTWVQGTQERQSGCGAGGQQGTYWGADTRPQEGT